MLGILPKRRSNVFVFWEGCRKFDNVLTTRVLQTGDGGIALISGPPDYQQRLTPTSVVGLTGVTSIALGMVQFVVFVMFVRVVLWES